MFESTSRYLVVLTFVSIVFLCTILLSYKVTNHDLESSQIAINELSKQNLRALSTPPVRDDISFIYVVGVEGTGHHGVTPAIATIAKSCNYQLVYRNFRMQAKQVFRDWEKKLDDQQFPIKVFLLDDQSFPTRAECRYCTLPEIKRTPIYNLESLYLQAQAENIHIRFIHLSRDFYSTVASHPDIDGTFKQHATVMQRFLKHIDQEYTRIATRQMGLWTTVHYEWFRDLKNCAALAAGIIEFAGWSNCDIPSACEQLHQRLRNSTYHPMNEMDLEYARSLDTNVTIPVMRYVH